MDIILQEDVESLGTAGEVVKVKAGFGRNYLIPTGKAVLANPRNLKMLEHQRQKIVARQAKAQKVAEELAGKLGEVSLTISREVGEEDKLFGSVTNRDIAEALRAEGVTLDKRLIQLPEPIRLVGVYDIKVRLHPEVEATLKLWVVKK